MRKDSNDDPTNASGIDALKETAVSKPTESSGPADLSPGKRQPPARKRDQRGQRRSLPGGHHAQLEVVRLGDITGPHQSLAALASTADSVNRILRAADPATVPKTDLLMIVGLIRVGHQYQCVSHPAEYSALRCTHPADFPVPAVVFDGFNDPANDETLRNNADLQTLIGVCRIVPPDLRTTVRALVERLPEWARRMLGGGRPSLNAIRDHLRISIRKPTAELSFPDDVVETGHDINTPIERRNDRKHKHDGRDD